MLRRIVEIILGRRGEPAVEAASVRKVTLVVDENLHQLVPALREVGFKVLTAPKGTSDDELKDLASTWAILTQNDGDFIPDMKSFDYDVVSVRTVKFIDPDTTRRNRTARLIADAVRSHPQFSRSGSNWLLTVHDDGSSEMKEIVV